MPLNHILSCLLVLVSIAAAGQNATIKGVVTDETGTPLGNATIGITGSTLGTSSDSEGRYSLSVPADTNMELKIRYLGFFEKSIQVNLAPGETRSFNAELKEKAVTIGTFEVHGEADREKPMTKIDVAVVDFVPTATGGVEKLLQAQAMGVQSNSELSSQYNVRGGNFDENLVYVNGIEVYRPFLIRSGQQEGLSFINSDLVESVSFSSGGFEAKYGDKMSSVLDIEYKKPEKFAGSVSAGLLGANVHLENANDSKRFTQIHGFRYFSNQYLLGSLDVSGGYRPKFIDYQTYLTYDISPEWELAFLGNFALNQYQFIPESRETDFGTVNQAIKLKVFFDGQEIDQYQTGFGAFSGTWKPRYGLELKFTTSAFVTQERETFDLEGAYRLAELETDLSKESVGEETFVLGYGSYLDHARNYLNARVVSFQHNGKYQPRRNAWLWGVKYRRDMITDELSEWAMIDSAGFSVPHNGQDVAFFETIKSFNTINTNRVMGYLQRDMRFTLDTAEITFSLGGRYHYWDFNHQLTLSPRASASLKPNWKRDWIFKASFGFYHQPPFYREIRDLFGNLNPEIRAQTSIHYVLGADYNFHLWNRPFKFATDVYYKQLRDIIPYEIDNVRIRYYAENNAKGYAAGADFKIAGQFVKGVDSWASLSILKTAEDLNNDSYMEYYNAAGETIVFGVSADQAVVDSALIEPGYVPRPTDQRVSFALTFQDYLPRNENFKMHLSLFFGSGLPTGPPSYTRYKDVFRMPQYRRVDIGFSALLLGKGNKLKEGHFLKKLDNAWLTLEVFNLLAVNNTISYIWVKDSRNIEYGIPNYLTARRLNVKLIVKF